MSTCETVDGEALIPEDLAAAKAIVRQRHLRARADIDGDAQRGFAARLATIGPDIVRIHAWPSGDPVVSLFQSIGSEPDAAPLAAALQAAQLRLSLPVDHSSGGSLVYREWAPGDLLAAGPLGIGEPLDEAAEVDPDVLFIPMVAFDRGGGRLGYGAGNVDATLTALRARKRVLAIGVAFASQEEPAVPASRRDEKVDLIITDREVIDCRG